MARKAIPDSIRKQAQEIVGQFNKEELASGNIYYTVRFRGKYLYLDRYSYGRSGPICRLTYNGAIDNWEFAIFKYSDERYDPEEWMFPGSGHVDGTIEGAMKAGLEAYPP